MIYADSFGYAIHIVTQKYVNDGSDGDIGTMGIFGSDYYDEIDESNEQRSTVCPLFTKIAVGLFEATEGSAGIGTGLGFDISGTGVSGYADEYIRLDDGEFQSGKQAVGGFGVAGAFAGAIADHPDKVNGKNNPCQRCEAKYNQLMKCRHSNTTLEGSYGPISLNNEGEIVVSLSLQLHIFVGGHISIGVNVNEFLKYLVQ